MIPGAIATSEPKDIILDSDTDIGHNAGAVVRFEANLAAIRTLKQVEADERPATPDEQSVLARYSGFGDSAFNDAFRRYSSRDESPWKRRGETLKVITTEPEYEAIERSRLNAFYTSPQVIKTTWDALERLGVNDIDHPKVLEPSAGSGRFLGFQPIELAARSKRTAVELDNLTGRMLKQTYPETAVYVMGYQNAPLQNDAFDIAISNVPFGDYAVSDPAFTKGRKPLTRQIHNYFFAKTLDKLKPGGVLAFVTSHYTLDAPTAKPIREMLAEKADLLGAIRLPSDAFSDTQVVTDLIFMRKRLPGEAPGDTSWVDTQEVEIKDRHGSMGSHRINKYYAQHPLMVMGVQTLDRGRYQDNEYTVVSRPDTLLSTGLKAGIGRLPQNVIKDIPTDTPRAVATPSGINTSKGSRVIGEDGAIWIKKDADIVPANLPTVDQGKVKAMLSIRDAARKVIGIQVNAEPDTELVKAQEILNREYDAFATAHGPLNANKNKALMKGDPDGPFLLALERDDRAQPAKALRGLSKVSLEKANAIKMPLFSGRTIHGMKERTVNDDTDAAIVSMNETGRLDFKRMAELLGQTPEQVRSSLAEKHRIFKNPIGGWETSDEYLTGDVREKLQIAQAAASAKPVYRKNVEALKAIQPPDIPPSQISVGLGAPWIPASDVNDFIDDLLDANSYHNNYFNYVPATGEWVAENQVNCPRSKSYSEWGTERMAAPEIIKRLLNGKAIEVKDRTSDDKSVRNDKETVAAQEKAIAIQKAYKAWIWQDDERAQRLAKQYNTIFNSYRPRSFDGSHMDLPGMREVWARKIHPHIKDAIWRVTQDRTALLAHEVGFGKTAVMVGSGMELKRLGLARKNMYVVPKAIQSQFKKEFQDIYPYANILFPEESDFSPANRQEFVSRVATGDWDAVILSDSQFRRIPVRPETAVKFLHDEIGMIRDALEDESANAPAYGRKSRTHKDLQKALVRAEEKLESAQARVGSITDKTMCFEDLGVDQIFVDEADMYKNLAFSTRMGRIKGLPNTNSDRAWDMYQKTRYLQDHGGNGVVFATGTPIANTIAEMYTMMRYLQNDMLEAKGLGHFDAWAKTFGETTESLEQTPTGAYRLTSRFAKFKNMSELSALWQNVSDIRVAEEVPNIMKLRPRLVDDEGKQKRTVVKISPDDALLNYMAELAKRADELPGKDPRDDNMLKIANDARMASLDMRMVDRGAAANPDGKIAAVSKNVARIHRETTDNQGTQLVFLDIGTPKANDVPKKDGAEDPDEEETQAEARVLRNVYGVLKDNLLAAGVPAAEIAFIHDCKSNEQRKRLYEKVNKGEVRVLIGSTGKMGAGVNIQERAAALHHMDAPWRPRDIEQREGRIIRQGNRVYGPKFDENGVVIDPGPGIKIYTYVTERSFDAYMWQAIESKSKAIKSIMRRDNPPREIEDVDSFTMSAGEAKAVATGNPDVMKMVQLKNDVARLQMLEASHTDARIRANSQLRALPHEISGLKESINKMDTDAGLVKTTQDSSFAITVQGKSYTERSEAGKALMKTISSLPLDSKATPIGKYRGFTISAMNQGEAVGYKIMASNPEVGLNYTLKDLPYSGLTESGVLSRIDNKISAIPDELAQRLKDLDRAETNLKNYEKQSGGTFAHKDRMETMQSEMTRIEKKLQGEKVEEPAQAYIGLTDEPLEGEEAPAYRYGEIEDELSSATIDKVPPDLPSLPNPADTAKERNVVYGAMNDTRSDEKIAQDMASNEPTATQENWKPSQNDLPGWDTTDIKKHQEAYEDVFEKVQTTLAKSFTDEQVEGRVKTLPSIVKKLKKKNVSDSPFTHNNMEDIAGLRVTFDDLDDLKAGVKAIKGKYEVKEDEDYVTNPKDGYRSYHLTIEQDGKPLEVQFRTPNMTKWADWTHNTLYDHTDVTKKKVGEAGFKELQAYAQAMSDYYAAKDAGQEPVMPDVPKIADKIGGGMEPRPIRFPKPQKAAYPATATGGAKQIGITDPEPPVRMMGHEAIKVETKRMDNIDYELYRTADGLGIVRAYDNDGKEMITLKKWPKFEDAKTEYSKMLHNLTAGDENQPSKLIPDTKENRSKLFDAGGAKWISVKDIVDPRPSPEDAIERSSKKAELTLKGEHTPRQPLEVWEVERKDGTKFYSLRDGNTTLAMLTRQGWDEIPVRVTMDGLKSSDLKPVADHKRTQPWEMNQEDYATFQMTGRAKSEFDPMIHTERAEYGAGPQFIHRPYADMLKKAVLEGKQIPEAIAQKFGKDWPNEALALGFITEDQLPDYAKGKGVIEDTWHTGNTVRASGTDPNHKYEFRLKVVDLDDIQASHTTSLAPNPNYPAELQPRVRDRAASKVQVEKIARELNPEALLRDVGSLDRGPVIVGPDMMVESGNGRTIALKLAAQEYPEKYAAYRDQLIAEAESHGITGSHIKNMTHPVLVRERITDVDRVKFAGESNQIAVMAMSPYEQAIQDSKQIKDNTIADLTVGENQSIDQALISAGNRPLVREFSQTLTNNERAAIQDQSGKLNQTGLQRLKAALFAKTFPGEAGQRLTKAFFESLDPTVKNVENGLFASLPAMAKAEGLIRSGERYTDLSLSEDLSKAVDMLARLRQEGLDPDKYIQQGTMWERELTPTQEDLMLHINSIGKSPKKIRELAKGYAERVESSPHPEQSTMFASGERVSKEDILAVVTGKKLRAATPKLEIPKAPAGTDTGLQPDMFSGELKQVTVEGKGKELQADLFAHGELEKRRQEVADKPEKQLWYRGVDERNTTAADRFYTTDKDVAGDFGKAQQIEESELPKNPLTISDKETLAREIGYEGDPLAEKINAKVRFDDVAKDFATKNGYDGIIYENGTLDAPELHTWRSPETKEHFIFTPPEKKVIAEKVARESGELLTTEAAKSRLGKWKAEAKRIGKEEDHSNEVIISMFDRTGVWSQPYVDAGYTVKRYDLEHGDDLIEFFPVADFQAIKEQGKRVVGVLAAPPCTSYAGSGARWWKTHHDSADPEMVEKAYGYRATRYFDTPAEYAEALEHAVEVAVEFTEPDFYAMENPVGRIGRLLDLPDPTLTFQPANYGDPYTKKTLLWGKFNPHLPQANVEPTEGSKIHKLRGDVAEQKEGRSETPEGFAYAFFMANHPKDGKKANATVAKEEKPKPKTETKAKPATRPEPEKPKREPVVKITIKSPASTGGAKMTLMPAAEAKTNIQRVQESRTRRALASDNSRQAGIGRVEQWLKHPNQFDLPGVDTPGANGRPQLNKGLLEIRRRGGTVIKKGKARGKVTGRGSTAITKRGGMKVIGKGRKNSR